MSNVIKFSTDKIVQAISALIGSHTEFQVFEGAFSSWQQMLAAGQGLGYGAGLYLVTAPSPEGESLVSFFPASGTYDAYVKTYQLSSVLPYSLKVRLFRPIEFVAVTDDDTLLPKHLKLTFIKTTEVDDEFWEKLNGCISYALTETFRGKVVESSGRSAYFDEGNHWWNCELHFNLSGELAKTEHPDLGLALSTARFYIERGTPIRTTDRAGEGTKGTRAVSALPELKGVKFQWSKAD